MHEGLWAKHETDFDGMWKVFSEFADVFPWPLKDETSRKEYTEKILKYGYLIAVYFGDIPMGFQSGYANDLINKRAFSSLFALSQKSGLLRGRVMRMLWEATVLYTRECGMETLYGEVDDQNTAARKLYEQVGMKYVGRASDHSSYVMIDLTQLEKLRDETKQNN